MNAFYIEIRCVSFQYHSYGVGTGRLQVRELNANGMDGVVFEVEGVNGKC